MKESQFDQLRAAGIASALTTNARNYFTGSIDTHTFGERYTALWRAAAAMGLTSKVDACLQAADEDSQLVYEATSDGEALALILDCAKQAAELCNE